MKRILISLAIILITIAGALPVDAQTPSAVQLGDKLVLTGGYEAVCVGFTNGGKPEYQVDMSTPKYKDDLVTPIDTTWHMDSNGDYTNGADNFHAFVSDAFVNISQQDTKNLTNIKNLSWQPDVSVQSSMIVTQGRLGKMVSAQASVQVLSTVDNSHPTLLTVDPLNSNYHNNTLEWDLGNGVLRRLRLIEGMEIEYYVINDPLSGDLTINTNELSTGIMSNPVIAYDANRQNIPVTTEDGTITLTQSGLDSIDNLTYPLTIDPDTTFTTSASDGYLYNYSIPAVYSTARTATDAYIVNSTAFITGVENSYDGSSYKIQRSYLYFDTSALNGYSISAANLNLVDYSLLLTEYDDGESIQIQSGMPNYPHDPLVVGDYDLSNYIGNGGSKTIASFVSGYNTIALSAGGVTMINTAGITKFCLRTTGDINNTAPTGNNYIYFGTYELGVGYRPQLVVTFIPLSPAINSVPTLTYGQTTARLNSSIVDDGGDITCQVEFGYGTVTHSAANYALYTHHTTVTIPVSDYKKNDTPYLDVTGLSSGTTYYYRVKITNDATSVVSTDEQNFTTSAVLDGVTSFYGFPQDTSITLTWGMGTGASQTLIRYSTTAYPTSTSGTDGSVLVYLGSDTGYIQSGLSNGTTYYYTAWSESGGAYSVDFSNLAMTTKTIGAGATLSTPIVGAGWNQAPNPTFLVNIQPFYSIFNNLADDWAIPRATAWIGLFLFIDMLIGIFLYIRFRAPALALIVSALFMAFGVTVHILPEQFIILTIILALGGWSSRPTYNV